MEHAVYDKVQLHPTFRPTFHSPAKRLFDKVQVKPVPSASTLSFFTTPSSTNIENLQENRQTALSMKRYNIIRFTNCCTLM